MQDKAASFFFNATERASQLARSNDTTNTVTTGYNGGESYDLDPEAILYIIMLSPVICAAIFIVLACRMCAQKCASYDLERQPILGKSSFHNSSREKDQNLLGSRNYSGDKDSKSDQHQQSMSYK